MRGLATLQFGVCALAIAAEHFYPAGGFYLLLGYVAGGAFFTVVNA